jgi:hypothetical protein
MRKFALTLFLAFAGTGITSSAVAESCPVNIGDYGYHDGRGGSFGETLNALQRLRPHCVCMLNKQWIKEWYYGWDDVNGRLEYGKWLKKCNR